MAKAHHYTRFPEVVQLVEAALIDGGYKLKSLDCQEWPAHYFLSKPGLNGSADLFFGPVSSVAGGPLSVPYLLIHGDSHRNSLQLPPDSDPSAVAGKVVGRTIELLDQSMIPQRTGPNVGVGLRPLESRPGHL